MLLPTLLLQGFADGQVVCQAASPITAAQTPAPSGQAPPAPAEVALPEPTGQHQIASSGGPMVKARDNSISQKTTGGQLELTTGPLPADSTLTNRPPESTARDNHSQGVNAILSENTPKSTGGIVLDAPSSTQSASDPTTKKKRVLSDETREKMRQAKLGKERSPETKAKIRQTLSGKGKSLAHIAASSEAHKQRFEGCPEGFEWLRLPKNIRDTPGKADRKNRWSPVVVPYFFEWEREFPEDPPHVVVKLEQDQYNLIRDLHECAALDIPADYNKVTERITVGIRRLPKPKPHTYSTPSPGDTDPRGYLTINGYFRLPEDTLDSIVLWHPLRVGDTLRQVACSKVTFFSPLFGRGWGPDASIKVDVYVYEE